MKRCLCVINEKRLDRFFKILTIFIFGIIAFVFGLIVYFDRTFDQCEHEFK